MENVTLGFDPQIGDKAHVLYYSDIHPCTVIKRTKKFVTVQMDNYKLNKEIRPNIIPGGFAGHCTNNREQRWIITENPEGTITEGYLGSDNEWYEKGTNRRNTVEKGYVKFHDYNY